MSRKFHFSMKYHIVATVILTAVISLIGFCFYVQDYNEVIAHPQFNNFDHLAQFTQKIKEAHMWNWYRSFFIVDLIWAPTLLLLLFRIVTNTTKDKDQKMTTLAWLLLIVSVIAYILDVFENISYLTIEHLPWSTKAFQNFVNFKTIFYALVIFTFLLFLYQNFIFPNLAEIRRAIKACRFSLIIIILLLMLSTQMDQGSTVIIHLLQHPRNILAALAFFNALALACAHYPDYIDMNTHATSTVTWDLKPDWLKKLGIGYIVYTFPGNTEGLKASQAPQRQISNTDDFPKHFLDHFRKSIGGVLWLTWIYAILFIFKKYVAPALPINSITLIFAFMYGVLYYYCSQAKISWDEDFTAKKKDFEKAIAIKNHAERKKALNLLILPKYKFFLVSTLITFILTLLLAGLAIYFACTKQWQAAGCSLLCTSCCNLIFYILFQNFRKAFSYYIPPSYLAWILIRYFNDDLIYVMFFSFFGIAGIAIIIFFTRNPSLVNALVFILIFFYIYYGLFTNLLKHHIYYKQKKLPSPDHWWVLLSEKFFISYVPILPVIILIWFVFAGSAGNKLHVLRPTDGKEEELGLNEYLHRYGELHDSTHYHPYFLATYGGGLRASVWTMLLLEKIDSTNKDFYTSTLAMSGVSGGFVGLSMFNAIHTEDHSMAAINATIDTIGKHNILSIDVAYLFSADLFREMQPYRNKFKYPDRAGRSMQEYASLVQPDTSKRKQILDSGFRHYWKKGFDQRPKRFTPALIGNSTGTHGRYGVAFSVRPDDFNAVFPAASDMISESKGSIKYLDATSSTERFPLFSPSAQIEEKGHFLDGGYFENSGLLSLMNLYSYIQKNNPDHIPLDSAKVILIINSKESYIRHILGDSVIAKNELSSGELLAIVSTVVNIDVLPLSLEEKCRNDFGKNFIRIYLPYPVTYNDVTSLIRGEPKDPISIQDTINAYNKKIKKTWEDAGLKDVNMVPPALARVLSDPAVLYLKTMMNHPDVQAELNQLRVLQSK